MKDDLSGFLFFLSGQGLYSEASQSGASQTLERSTFVKRAAGAFFMPLKHEFRGNPQFLGLLAMARAFVKLGYLKTVAQIEGYLELVSPLCLSEQQVRDFLSDVKAQAKIACPRLNPAISISEGRKRSSPGKKNVERQKKV
ncbi:hypothetical protein NKR23_g2677 [Pleurostoma richardsiae]|uniref:Uncharacterized protein n=1 Tax=Pleurostoma richardsiae TaxID=41990 RepID=A0AA38RLV4_9PEZI|nr:hypothetical protein NKR23_g2677 [Pleurostoma richardsiae]